MTPREKINCAIELLSGALAGLSEAKARTQADADSTVDAFTVEHLQPCPGNRILFANIFKRFCAGLPPEEKPYWSRTRFSRALRTKLKVINGSRNHLYVCDVAWRDAYLDSIAVEVPGAGG